MAIFKPTGTMQAPTNFLGTIEVGIIGFTDRSGDFDWADLFLEIELSVKNSEYSNKMSILGEFDKDTDGKIKGGSVLNKLYRLFDTIGCTAGLTIDGKWEDAEGNSIEDIAKYLNDGYCTKTEQYTAYSYKKKPKPGKKVYTEVYPRLYPLTAEGKAACEKDIAWLKSKGHIKEADASDMPQKNDSQMADSALSNL
jgi:hypothetical protein